MSFLWKLQVEFDIWMAPHFLLRIECSFFRSLERPPKVMIVVITKPVLIFLKNLFYSNLNISYSFFFNCWDSMEAGRGV